MTKNCPFFLTLYYLNFAMWYENVNEKYRKTQNNPGRYELLINEYIQTKT